MLSRSIVRGRATGPLQQIGARLACTGYAVVDALLVGSEGMEVVVNLSECAATGKPKTRPGGKFPKSPGAKPGGKGGGDGGGGNGGGGKPPKKPGGGDGGEGGKGLGSNPFKGKKHYEAAQIMRDRGFLKGDGPGEFVNPKTGRKYSVDRNLKGFEKGPHVDVRRLRNYKLPKRRLFF